MHIVAIMRCDAVFEQLWEKYIKRLTITEHAVVQNFVEEVSNPQTFSLTSCIVQVRKLFVSIAGAN